ncbi:MAG: tRNA pseudouridine(55) synthase TruB [Nitrospiraceae bacterium]|nr:tRNA pseudouridine(55) synthase TruB [Nitrospiraceae bacterium]
MNGVMIVNKPAGMTSHDVVNRVRRLLKEKRIGHTGTLDPLATGVLVLCIGKATRIARYLESDDKEYVAAMQLGITTDTLDADGQVIETRACAPFSRTHIDDVLAGFRGMIRQRPPAYSAVKVGGVPAYKLARKGNAPVLQERQVAIDGLSILAYDHPLVRLLVSCSKGTYIRTLCADIGERLGCGGHVTELTRTRSGRFVIGKARSLEEIEEAVNREKAEELLVTMRDALAGLPEVQLTREEAERAGHGNAVSVGDERMTADEKAEQVLLIGPAGELVAVGSFRDGLVWPKAVLL